MSGAIRVDRADASDAPAVRALLRAAGLTDLGIDDAMRWAVVARSGPRVVGSAAVEPYGGAGLLRSVAVDAPLRGTGLGARLVGEAIELARSGGVADLYLLTETAERWFPRFGFEPVPRAELPPPIRASREVTEACAESAVAMRLRLEEWAG